MTIEAELEGAPSLGILAEVDDDHVIKTQVLRAALELDVIPAIAAGHHDVDSIARATGCSPAGMRLLLDSLCAVKLLRPSNGGYALTPTAEAYVDPASPACCAEIYLDDLRAWDRFTENVRTGRLERDYGGPGSDRVWAAWAAQPTERCRYPCPSLFSLTLLPDHRPTRTKK